MKIGDEVYVHGFVDEIRGNTVIIKNKGGCFGTFKKEVSSGMEIYEQIVYPTDKFSAFVIDDMIHIISKEKTGLRVTIETINFTTCI